MYTRLIGQQVFLNPKGRAAWKHDKPIRLLWTKALAAAGVRYRFPRQLRHTYGTWMLMAGESPRWVAEQMGHEDASITHKHYSRWIEDENPDAGMKAAVKFADARVIRLGDFGPKPSL
jgi:integrase